jgi:D-beta-D-heptose 7-phosphate kinase/D-beta-D-heptose 1-phosphate adenosyltransferase
MARQRILVIGDLMLDRYIYGGVARISPEAPVPVLDVHREISMPGGASNVAWNIREIGSGAGRGGSSREGPRGRRNEEALGRGGWGWAVFGKAPASGQP